MYVIVQTDSGLYKKWTTLGGFVGAFNKTLN